MSRTITSLFDRVEDLPGPDSLGRPMEIDGRKWLPGQVGGSQGPAQTDIMVVGQNPGATELRMNQVFIGPSGQLLNEALTEAGFSTGKVYITNAVKYGTGNNAAPKQTDITACLRVLVWEITVVKPKLIIAVGATAVKALLGHEGEMNRCRGAVVESPRLSGTPVYTVWHPAYILRNHHLRTQWVKDLRAAKKWMDTGKLDCGVGQFELITDMPRFQEYLDMVASQPADRRVVALDAEWQGGLPTEPGAYMRTLQMCHDYEHTKVMRFYPAAVLTEVEDNWRSSVKASFPDPVNVYPDCLDIRQAMPALAAFLRNSGCRVIGHNVKADGLWLLHYGVDIRPSTVWDTMLAENLMDNNNQLGLEHLTQKYTLMGRYDKPVGDWVKVAGALTGEGYGAVPDDLLLPYSAGDAEATLRIFHAQLEDRLSPSSIYRVMARRGLNGEYPSLLDSVIRTSLDIYEMETNGLCVDIARMNSMTAMYSKKRDRMNTLLKQMIVQRGGPGDFNPRSVEQVRELLFGRDVDWKLKLTPVITTSKPAKSWEWVLQQPPALQKFYNPSTNQTSLELLQGKNDIVKYLLNLRRVDQICKNFLAESAEDDTDGFGKGINGRVWGDGRLHPSFNPTTDTGRMRSSRPNVQNFPKASEGYLREIFAGDVYTAEEFGDLLHNGTPVSIRTIFIPPPGCVLLEADYKQAELFVLSGLSGDMVMYDMLTTPGKDLHDMTTVTAFGLTVLTPDGSKVDQDGMLQLAKSDPKAFKALQEQLVYVDQKGRQMSRKEFKNTLRVAGKSINFGIPYGRGAQAIAMQVESETGKPVNVEEIKQAIAAWKDTYRQAWEFMQQCGSKVLDPGYIDSAWGRRRFFRCDRQDTVQVASMQREAGNFPIQSTVADTVGLAAAAILDARTAHKSHFTLINQMHDALLFAVPKEEMELAEAIVTQGMEGIKIPSCRLPNRPTLSLNVDSEIFPERWGEKE